MKILFILASLVATPHALVSEEEFHRELVSVREVTSNPGEEQLDPSEDEPCLGSDNFKMIVNGECSYENIVDTMREKMQRKTECKHAAERELRLLLNIPSDARVRAGIERVCDREVDRNSLLSFPFDDVTQKGPKFDKEFFDGGTDWNEWAEIPQKNDKARGANFLHKGANRVELMKKNARTRGIEWPEDVPNFEACNVRAVMCCWVDAHATSDMDCGTEDASLSEQDCPELDPTNNTDVCLVDLQRSRLSNHVDGGFTVFSGNTEGPTYCHGFAWENDEKDLNSRFKGNTLFQVAMLDNMYEQGFVRNVPGSPMCGCIEQMPIVTRADCTQVKMNERYLVSYNSRSNRMNAKLVRPTIGHEHCKSSTKDNDLSSFYDRLVMEGKATEEEKEIVDSILVGDDHCSTAVDEFLQDKGLALTTI